MVGPLRKKNSFWSSKRSEKMWLLSSRERGGGRSNHFFGFPKGSNIKETLLRKILFYVWLPLFLSLAFFLLTICPFSGKGDRSGKYYILGLYRLELDVHLCLNATVCEQKSLAACEEGIRHKQSVTIVENTTLAARSHLLSLISVALNLSSDWGGW